MKTYAQLKEETPIEDFVEALRLVSEFWLAHDDVPSVEDPMSLHNENPLALDILATRMLEMSKAAIS